MSRRISYQMDYDAPVATVVAMLADPAFREEVCRFQGVSDVEVSIRDDGGVSDVVIDQWQPTAGVPAIAKKIVGEKTNIVQTERWTSPTHADIAVSIPGKPGDMVGTAVLVESGAGTVETVELTVKVNIPLVGGKLEGIVGDLLLKALRAEHKVGRDYLSR